MVNSILPDNVNKKRYDVPWIDGEVYKTENSSIADAVTNRAVVITGITKFTWVEIINDNETTGQNLIVKLNANTNDEILVYPGEIKVIRNFKMESIYLSNSSGTTINYRINAFGSAE